MGCRLPGANAPDEFWRLLAEGRSAIGEVPSNRWHRDRYYDATNSAPGKMVSKWGGFVDNLTGFDAQFWGISPREALRMDPQQRWLLEAAWEALEDSGTPPLEMRAKNVGVFVGISSNDYGSLQLSDYPNIDMHTNSGGVLCIAANRVSFLLDLKGPSLAVDTACSSSLVAITLACQNIWSGDCDTALAGGANAIITPHASVGFSKASMLSPSGRCFAFDSRANGYVRSEGAAMLHIKPLSTAIADHDRVYAVIRAAVTNQDGRTSTMTIPGVESQAAMLTRAYADANIDPRRVAYVEAHGTGTQVGDPIEANALGQVLGRGRDVGEECLIGSVKTNIGHLESGSGVAGVMKAAMILHHDTIPASLNFEKPNPNIPFEQLRLKVAAAKQSLPRGDEPPVIAVNSFGFGGANAHIVFESPPRECSDSSERNSTVAASSLRTKLGAQESAESANGAQAERPSAKRPQLLPISARDDGALVAYADSYREMLRTASDSLRDIALMAGRRKEHHEHRLVAIGENASQMRRSLDMWRGGQKTSYVVQGKTHVGLRPPVFVFTGQGPQWWGMGRELLEREPLFRDVVSQIDRHIFALGGWSLLEEMSRPEAESRIHETRFAQPAIFAIQVGLAALWKSWGVEAAKVVGHSVGEVAAAYVAGIYSLEDATRVIYHRSRLQDRTRGGAMMAVGVEASSLRPLLASRADSVGLAAINSPSLVTVAGEEQATDAMAAELAEAGVFHKVLPVNYSFHTAKMDPIHDELLESLSEIRPQPGTIPFISTVTGDVLSGERLDATYWWRNVRKPVLFAPALEKLIDCGDSTILELGPHPALKSSMEQCFAAKGETGFICHSLRRGEDESLELLSNAARLHNAGAKLDWSAIIQTDGAFVDLPRYPWQHESFWLDEGHMADRRVPEDHPLLGMRVAAAQPTWRQTIDPRVFDYIQDHSFWDSIIFPASGYGEIALAVAAELFPGEPYVVEDLESMKALFVSTDNPPTIQVVFDEDQHRLRVFSSTNKKDWELNSECRLVLLETGERDSADLESIRNRLSDCIDHERCYQEFHAAGYQFGPRFSLIQQLWRSPGEALAEVVVPDEISAQSSEYRFHPSVLDACFQVFRGVQVIPETADPADYFFLPAMTGRIRLHRPTPPKRLWVHAQMTREDDKTSVSNLFVYDSDGRPVADILSFAVNRHESKMANDLVENCLYEFRFEPRRLRGSQVEGSCEFPSPSEIVASTGEQIASAYAERELGGYFCEFTRRMESIVLQCIQNACLDLGWDYRVGDQFTTSEFVERLDIAHQHRRLARAELRALELAGLLEVRNGSWFVVQELTASCCVDSLKKLAEDFPKHASEVRIVQTTGPNLSAVLSGKMDSVELLFPAGSNGPLEDFYTEAGDFPVLNAALRDSVAAAVSTLPDDRAVRVLEVGAGTGSLTREILPTLPADRSEYYFTDIGPAFLATAKKQFAEFPFVDYLTLDINEDASKQGMAAGGCDLILATNVLHATRDLRKTIENLKSCLADGGMLVFLEVVRRRPVWDNVFGLLRGWWAFEDESLRSESPLLSQSQWVQLLEESGFQDVKSITGSPKPDEFEQAVFFAAAPEFATTEDDAIPKPEETDETTLVFEDIGGVTSQLIEQLQSRGGNVIRVRPGACFQELDCGEFEIDPRCIDDYQSLFASGSIQSATLKTVVHAWSLDKSIDEDSTCESLAETQQTGVLSGFRLAQALRTHVDDPARVYFVTRDMQPVTGSDRLGGLASTPLMGLLRVANNEHFDNRWTNIDLDSGAPSFEADSLCDEVLIDDSELEVAYRGRRRYVHRLSRVRLEELPKKTRVATTDATGGITPYRLETSKLGSLSNLSLNETWRREPGPNEVEIRVKAGGVNFRDVMKVLGMYPGDPIDLLWFGDDVAGVVERVGSNVTSLQPGEAVAGMAPYCFRAYVTVDSRMVFKKPAEMSFLDAATLPTVFLTSHYAISHLARARRGESILIHAGAGGVGQAAIQIALNLGLQVFATAGSDEKRELLRKMGVDHVMNSRTVEFADQIMEITDGAGVDIVLNSLAGEFIPKSFSVLAPFGRFLEIGKIDIYQNSNIGLNVFKQNISYFVIDLAQHLEQKPTYVAEMFGELAERFDVGDYQPLPKTVFPISDVVEAFRFMAQGKHIGKNVLSFDVDELTIAACTEDDHLFRSDGAYLITGGARGVGLELAKWLTQHGARHIVLMSRSGPKDDAVADIDAMRSAGAVVIDARGDVTKDEDVRAVIDQIQRELPPLKGVFHGAMVLDDEFMVELNDDRFRRVMDPKVMGAWSLHRATLDIELDHFICFSSFSSMMGAARQANYNAGNAFLDGLAYYRRGLGLPSMTVNWGALSGAGFVARNQKTSEYLEKVGLLSLSTDEALSFLGKAVGCDATRIAASRVDWSTLRRLSPVIGQSNCYESVTRENSNSQSGASIRPRLLAAAADERGGLMEDFLTEQVAGVFGIDSAKVDRETPLTNLGLDSLMAVDLMNRLESELAISFPMGNVLNGPDITMLAGHLLTTLNESSTGDDESATAAAASVDVELVQSDSWVDEFELSDSQRVVLRRESVHRNVIAGIKVRGALTRSSLQAELDRLLDSHILLRGTVPSPNENRQKIDSKIRISIDEMSIDEAELTSRIGKYTQRPFDLTNGPLLRVGLLRCGGQNVLLVCAHPIIADDWSLALLLARLLQQDSELQTVGAEQQGEVEYSYYDYVAWQHGLADGGPSEASLTFWEELLDGAPFDVPLPCLSAPAEQNGDDAHVERVLEFNLPGELADDLLVSAAEHEVSLRSLLFAALSSALHGSAGRDDFLIGYPVLGRGITALLGNVGRFETMTPIRSRARKGATFTEHLTDSVDLLTRAEAKVGAFPTMADRVVAPWVGQEQRLFSASFEYVEAPSSLGGLAASPLGRNGESVRWNEFEVEPMQFVAAATNSELCLRVSLVDGSILGTWRYNSNRYSVETMERVQTSFLKILRQAVADPGLPLAELADIEPVPASDASIRRIRVRQITASDVDFELESELDANVRPIGEATVCGERPTLLLTGSTGFLGAFLIDELLTETDCDIVCHVRAENASKGLGRVRDNLTKYGLNPAGLDDRVSAVVGDLSVERLGLSEEVFDRLAQSVDLVVHNGASVNLAVPYSSLKSVNVGSTREIIRFACHHRAKPIHYVSTFTVHTAHHNRGERVCEQTELPSPESLLHGYSQSKWVSERLLSEASTRGLPVSVYRPGHITGDSRTGASNTDDLLHTMVRVCLQLGASPLSDVEFDITPVDYVARSIVSIIRRGAEGVGTYLLTNPQPVRTGYLSDWLDRNEIDIESLSYDEWRNRLLAIADEVGDSSIRPLADIMAPRVLDSGQGDVVAVHPEFDNRRAREVLEPCGISCPPGDEELISTYLRYFQQVGFM